MSKKQLANLKYKYCIVKILLTTVIMILNGCHDSLQLQKVSSSDLSPLITTFATEKELIQGDNLNIDFPWDAHSKTVVFVLSEDCIYCKNAGKFYSLITDIAKSKGLGLLTIFPEDAVNPDKWMKEYNYPISHIIKSNIATLGIFVTPQMILVDNDAVVIDIWYGLPNEKIQKYAIDDFRRENKPDSIIIGKNEYLSLNNANDNKLILVDIRPRDAFKLSHKDGAINIPHDEILLRIKHEHDLTSIIVINCEINSDLRISQCVNLSKLLKTIGFNQTYVLTE